MRAHALLTSPSNSAEDDELDVGEKPNPIGDEAAAAASALQAAAVAHGDLDEPAAEKLLQRLVAERRLQCETW